jgi:hypothetical protein
MEPSEWDEEPAVGDAGTDAVKESEKADAADADH